MEIISVRWATPDQSVVIVNDRHSVPTTLHNRHWQLIQEWVNAGNSIEAPDPPQPVPTNAELIDAAGPVLVGFLRAYAKREGISLNQIKNAIVAEM